VCDVYPNDTGIWEKYGIRAKMGSLIIPEPTTFLLLAGGIVAAIRRRRKA